MIITARHSVSLPDSFPIWDPDGVKARIKEGSIHQMAYRAIASLCHPNRYTGHDNLGDWRVDHPLAPELVAEAACIAEQADPDILAIEDHTIVALHFFMHRFVDSMAEAPLSPWRKYQIGRATCREKVRQSV